MIRYAAGAPFVLALSILAVAAHARHDLLKLPAETRRFFSVGADDGSEGTRWAVLFAGSNGYWNYRHQVIAIEILLPIFTYFYVDLLMLTGNLLLQLVRRLK